MAEPTPGPSGERGPNSYPLKPRFEYRAPSFLWEYRYLAIIFVLVILVATVLLFRVPHRQYHGLTVPPPPSSEPIYVETIPEGPASSAH